MDGMDGCVFIQFGLGNILNVLSLDEVQYVAKN